MCFKNIGPILKNTAFTRSTIMPPINCFSYREFFEKLYGSLESSNNNSTKNGSKLDSSSSDDSSYTKKDEDEDPKNSEGVPSSPPIRPFPSFPLPSSLDQQTAQLLAARNLSYFPPTHHSLAGSFPGAGPAPQSATSVEAALRFPEFPFPGGLAAFRKFIIILMYPLSK